MRIYLIVNVSQVVKHREQVEVGEQKKEKAKQVEVDRVEEWEIEKILDKKKIRRVVKYLVQQKRFSVENNIWEREKNLKNAKEAVVKFKKRLNTK